MRVTMVVRSVPGHSVSIPRRMFLTTADSIINSSSQSITSLVGKDAGVDIAIVYAYTQIINFD